MQLLNIHSDSIRLIACLIATVGGAGANSGIAAEPEIPSSITVYSPAAPPNLLWSMNAAVAETLQRCTVARTVKPVAVALPDSINRIGAMSDRGTHLPIVTTVDFSPAVNGTGPDWHPYARPHHDLAFVATLYEVGLGVTVFDRSITHPEDLAGKTIAVPPRPSSLRLLTEALLKDGWGILDDVNLVDLAPSDVVSAAAAGRIDATTWNLMVEETAEAYRPLLPPLLALGQWLSVSDADVARINAANGFTTARVDIDRIIGENPNSGANAQLLSFRQALTAWSATDAALVTAVLQCLATARKHDPAGTLQDWPGLAPATMHPAALRFFRSRAESADPTATQQGAQ